MMNAEEAPPEDVVSDDLRGSLRRSPVRTSLDLSPPSLYLAHGIHRIH